MNGVHYNKNNLKSINLYFRALKKYPKTMDVNERWSSIAKDIEGKTKKQCLQRYKELQAKIKQKKGK